MSLAVLLQAAEYIERQEREMEHGYATVLPMPESYSRNSHTKHQRVRRSKSKLHSNRTTHNELEKNRRAHLRTCLERLKGQVPLGPDGSRHTTLGLLTRAKHFIQSLEDRHEKSRMQFSSLQREQMYLERRLNGLRGLPNTDYSMKRRSVSESSGISTVSSISSPSECGDDVDILGYTGNQSDSDDHSSVKSVSSDGGVTIFTRRLTLSDSPPIHSYAQQVL